MRGSADTARPDDFTGDGRQERLQRVVFDWRFSVHAERLALCVRDLHLYFCQVLQNCRLFGGGLNAGIVNYPGILNNGQITVEANTLSEKQASKGTKGGIGFNTSNVFLVIAYGVDMSDFAAVFKALGAQYALNLDGGGSAALYNGGYKAGPGRTLPNAIIFK